MHDLKRIEVFVKENQHEKSASVIWFKINNKKYLQERLGIVKYEELIQSILEKLPLKTDDIEIKSQLLNEIIVIASTNMGRIKSTELTNKLQIWFSKNNFFANDRYFFVNVKSIILTDFHKKKNLKALLVKVEKMLINSELDNETVYLGESREDKYDFYIKEQLLNAINKREFSWCFQQIISTKNIDKEYYQLNLIINCKNGDWLKRSEYFHVAKNFGFLKTINKLILRQAIDFIENNINSTLIINQNISSFILEKGVIAKFRSLKKFNLPKNSLLFKFNLEDIEYYMNLLATLSKELGTVNINVCVADFNCSKGAWKIARKINAKWIELEVVHDKQPEHYNNNLMRISRTIKKAHILGYKVYISKVDCNYFAADLWNLNLDYIQGDFSELSNKKSNEK